MLTELEIDRTEVESRTDFLLTVSCDLQGSAQVLGSEEELLGLHVAAAQVVAHHSVQLHCFACAVCREVSLGLVQEQ